MGGRAVLVQAWLLAGCLSASEGGGGGDEPDSAPDPGGADSGTVTPACTPIGFEEEFTGDEWQDVRWDQSWEDSDDMLSSGAGRAVIVSFGAADEYAAFESTDTFTAGDATCLHVEVPAMFKHGPEYPTDAHLVFAMAGDVEVMLGQSGGDLCCEAWDGEVAIHELCPVTYDPIDDRWWRLRFEGGEVFCETAPEAGAWVMRDRFEFAPSSAGRIVLDGGTWDPVAEPGQVEFDNLNR